MWVKGQWQPDPKPQQTFGPYRLDQRVLAVMPPEDLEWDRGDRREVVTLRIFHRRDDGVMRVRVEDSDGVRTWIDGDMIVRPA